MDSSDRFLKPLKALKCPDTDYELRRIEKTPLLLLLPQKYTQTQKSKGEARGDRVMTATASMSGRFMIEKVDKDTSATNKKI